MMSPQSGNVRFRGHTGGLYFDVVAAFGEAEDDGLLAARPRVIGDRYGLSSKEFTPAMMKAVFAELDAEKPRRSFTVGIVDDVTGLSLPVGRIRAPAEVERPACLSPCGPRRPSASRGPTSRAFSPR